MRFIFYAAFILFTLLCIIIAISNDGPINFSLSPLPINLVMPAYMLVFLGVFIGLFGGWIVSFISGISHARRHRLADNKIKELELKLNFQKSSTKDLANSEIRGKSAKQ